MLPLIFDLDNTIVRCSTYYRRARRRCAQRIVEEVPGTDVDEVLRRLLSIDHARSKEEGGYSRHRLPGSMARLYRTLVRERGQSPRDAVEADLRAIGEAVFDAPYEPFQGAVETLRRYRAAEHPTGLITKGDPEIQWRKIRRHGLEEVFDAVRVVTRSKRPDDYREMLASLGSESGASIGDSLSDDVAPARSVGLVAVLVARGEESRSGLLDAEDAGSSAETEPDHTIDSVSALPAVLPPGTGSPS